MRKVFVLTSAIAMLVAVLSTALAHMPDHPHMLVQSPEFAIIDGRLHVVGWRKCVDLAGGRSVPLQAHHDRVHTGRAGQALAENANIFVIPGAPLSPWANCAALEAALPIPVGPPPPN